ncbi:hypothetical protein C8R44DRAFT_747937 [Mycena epipterygia]|nr:hypothetical protein C8R44DRAFT_747937 [Mycena epipterygia]
MNDCRSEVTSHSLLVRDRDDDEHHAETQRPAHRARRHRPAPPPLSPPPTQASLTASHGAPVSASSRPHWAWRTGSWAEAVRLLMLSEAGARKAAADAKKNKIGGGAGSRRGWSGRSSMRTRSSSLAL